jgi:hypothetical protein
MPMQKVLRTLLAGVMLVFGANASRAWAARVIEGDGIVLYVSMSVVGRGGYGDSCGSLDDSTITANIGDHVHICYTGQNNTSTTLGIQSISNSIDGDLFTDFALDIQPGGQQLLADFRVTITGTMDVTHTWIARESEGSPPLTATAQTHIEATSPTVALSPPVIDAAVGAGAIARQTLTITNAGSGDLAWHFGEASALATLPGSPMTQPLFVRGATPVRPTAAMPSGTSVVPAYAVEVSPGGNQYVSLDMTNPSATVQIIPATLPASVSGGAFIDNDVGREYFLSDDAGLVTIDTQTGAINTINAATVPDPGDSGWRGLAWDPIGRVLYALSTNGILPSLYAIDAATGATTRLGEINDRTLTINGIYVALAVDSDGRIFAIDETNDLLVAVARDRYSLDGRISGYTVGHLGIDVDALSGLAFDVATNTLYLSTVDATTGAGAMYTVDTITGAATLVAPTGDGTAFVAMAAVAAARPCGVAGDVAWLSLATYIEAPEGPGESIAVDAILDATDLTDGTYEGYICLHSNDAAQNKIPIPVHLHVGDAIFDQGFEGAAP